MMGKATAMADTHRPRIPFLPHFPAHERRRLRRPRRLPIPWRLALGALLTAALLALAYLGICTYVAITLTRPERKPITVDPHTFGLEVENVTFTSQPDHLQLRGWLLSRPGTPAPTGPAAHLIILVHGRNGTRDDPGIGLVPIAAALVQQGYPVLTFDLRGHGESAGNRFSLGWYEQRDLEGAVDWAQARGFGQIGVFGFSMGGATVLLTAAADPRIRAVAVDSAYAELAPILAVQVPKASGLPPLFTPGTLLMVRFLYGYDVRAIRPLAVMAQLRDRPVLLLHGEADALVPVGDVERLWAARYGTGGDPQREYIHRFPGASHVGSYQSDPATYLTLVLSFWKTAFP
jgi:pimeloyl-ACP methyl ester carboxylesterase